jgi:hypothetical protein
MRVELQPPKVVLQIPFVKLSGTILRSVALLAV